MRSLLCLVLLAGCAGRPTPVQQPVTREAVVAVATPAPPAPRRMEVTATPALSHERWVAPGRWLVGGVRVQMHDDGSPEMAAHAFDEEIGAAVLGEGWVFWGRDSGRVFVADSFLGAPTAHGRAASAMMECVGETGDRLHFVGSDGRAYEVTADMSLRPLPALETRFVLGCIAEADGTRWLPTLDGPMNSSDGLVFSPVANRDAAEARMARRLHAVIQATGPSSHPFGLGLEHWVRGLIVGSADAASRPGPDCDLPAPWLALCESGVFVRGEGEMWQHISARQRLAVVDRAAGLALLGHGCRGEEGQLCLVERTGGSRTLDRPLSVLRARAFLDGWVYLAASRGLTAVQVETGVTRVIQVEPLAVQSLDPVTDGLLMVQAEFTLGAPLLVSLIRQDASAPERIELPERAEDLCLLDEAHGVLTTVDGTVYRTDDGARTWSRVDVRRQLPSHEVAGVRCEAERVSASNFVASLVDASGELPPLSVIAPEELAGPSPYVCERGHRRPERGVLSITAEERRGRVHLEASWMHGQAIRSGAGFLRGFSNPGYEGDWQPLASTDSAVLFKWTPGEQPQLVRLPARGAPSVVLADPSHEMQVWPGLADDFVLDEPRALRVVRADGRLVLVPYDVSPSAVVARTDGTVTPGRAGWTHDGMLRLAVRGGTPITLPAGLRPCAANVSSPAARWRVQNVGAALSVDGSRRGVDAVDGSRRGVDAVLDIDASGAACVRRLLLGGRVMQARDGVLVDPLGRECRPAEPVPSDPAESSQAAAGAP